MSHSNRKCAKWMEISGCKIDWTCNVGYGLIVNVQKDAWFSQFSENAIFEKIVKNVKILLFKNIQLFECFSIWWTKLFTCTQRTGWKFVERLFFSWKNAFLLFLPQNLSITK